MLQIKERLTGGIVNPYWAKFRNGTAGTVHAVNVEAARFAIRNDSLTRDLILESVDELPYPADPVLLPDLVSKYPCPSFCWTPEQCKGRTCCPKRRACSE